MYLKMVINDRSRSRNAINNYDAPFNDQDKDQDDASD